MALTEQHITLVAAELAPLASQHHASEYNRLKFGPGGCPTEYRPLSVHLPDFVRQLRNRQRLSVQADPWALSPLPRKVPSPVCLGPCGALPTDIAASRLEADIRAALADQLDVVPRVPINDTRLRDSAVKTSASHPINVSPVVPPLILPFITARLRPTQSPFPVLFHVPPTLSLIRLIHSDFVSSDTTPTAIPLSRTNIGHTLHATFSCHFPDSVKPATTIHSRSPSCTAIHRLSRSLSPHRLSSSSNSQSVLDFSGPFLLDNGHFSNTPSLAASLGNLFLSSCPGKKVRLDGPVKGRSTVCRDLDMDLQRMKNLGVGCVICCLDDAELDFLGAPWSKYEYLAGRNGIDVLRIPTPEGLAPLTPVSLDTQLLKVINTYTLLGVPVLVHCRGGVGRAGVIACCWLIRLGLCGWPKDEAPGPPFSARKETVQFVESVIAVVRRRRSMKAIETYEQVRFLVDFVEYLRQGHMEDAK